MQAFDQALFHLHETGDIRYEDGLRNTDSMNEPKFNIKLNSKHARWRNGETESDVELGRV